MSARLRFLSLIRHSLRKHVVEPAHSSLKSREGLESMPHNTSGNSITLARCLAKCIFSISSFALSSNITLELSTCFVGRLSYFCSFFRIIYQFKRVLLQFFNSIPEQAIELVLDNFGLSTLLTTTGTHPYDIASAVAMPKCSIFSGYLF